MKSDTGQYSLYVSLSRDVFSSYVVLDLVMNLDFRVVALVIFSFRYCLFCRSLVTQRIISSNRLVSFQSMGDSSLHGFSLRSIVKPFLKNQQYFVAPRIL